VGPGKHTLRVRATDQAGNKGEDREKFTVEGPPPREEVITQPSPP